MSFNFLAVTTEDEEEKLPVIYEWARNLDTLELLVKEGRFYFVSKNEAIKIWILKTLNRQTSRYTHRAYSSDYGNEIGTLFGRCLKKSLLKAEIKRCVEEALLVNPYIKKISNLSFYQKGSRVDVNFTVTTVYGDFEQEFSFEKEE